MAERIDPLTRADAMSDTLAMGSGPSMTTTERMMRRRMPVWIHEAFDGISGMDLIRAVSLWKTLTDRSSHKLRRKSCAWCGTTRGIDAGMCLACRKGEAVGWRLTVESANQGKARLVPPVEDVDQRLRRVEAALFMEDGVGRVEDGPFAPESIQQMIRAGAKAEKDQEQADRSIAELEFDGKL